MSREKNILRINSLVIPGSSRCANPNLIFAHTKHHLAHGQTQTWDCISEHTSVEPIEPGDSAAVVFIDLTEAFYRIFRPLCMEHEVTDESLAAFLHKLNMPSSAMHELWSLLSGPNALELANLPRHLRKSIFSIHKNTRFWVRDQPDVVETSFGSRPGDPFADVCFSYVWARVLLRSQDYMQQHHLLDSYPAFSELQLFSADSALRWDGPRAWFLGPTWMDDTAICVSSSNADELIGKAARAAEKFLELCTEHGMSPNLKRGKTEILLSLRGAKSRKLRIQHFGPDASRTLPVVTEHSTYEIPLTNNYLLTTTAKFALTRGQTCFRSWLLANCYTALRVGLSLMIALCPPSVLPSSSCTSAF